MMQQIVFPRAGDPSVMELHERPDPTPGPGQVRIAVEASGINFADLMARMGMYPDAPPFPFVMGYEVAGDVDAVGEGVDPAWVGKPVVALCRFGGYSTSIAVDVQQVAVRPEGLGPIEGAAIPVVGLTAWIMLEEFGRVREGDRVLVHSAGGGVGLAALELIKYRGATAIGTASAGKHAFLRERGYDQLIDYRTQDFEEVLAGEPKLDLILDAVGGDSWAKGLRLLRAGGRICLFGMSSAVGGSTAGWLDQLRLAWEIPWLSMNPVALINANKGVCGVNMGRIWNESERVTTWLEALLQRWEGGHFRPVVHATKPFSEVAEAHALIHRRENVGKVILVPG
jgi:NADPH:quinone reductase-like Zn-dependent oxidoreductase